MIKIVFMISDTSSAEGFNDGLNGFLVENEVASLTKKISELMEYPDAIKKAGEGALNAVPTSSSKLKLFQQLCKCFLMAW